MPPRGSPEALCLDTFPTTSHLQVWRVDFSQRKKRSWAVAPNPLQLHSVRKTLCSFIPKANNLTLHLSHQNDVSWDSRGQAWGHGILGLVSQKQIVRSIMRNCGMLSGRCNLRLNDVRKMTVILKLGNFNGIMLKLQELCFHVPFIVCSYHSPENI